jgi:hypothetical protein
MRRRTVKGVALAVVTLVLVAGCSSPSATSALDGESMATATPSGRPSLSPSPEQEEAMSAAVRTLRQYLDEWVTDGAIRAGGHLVESQRIPRDAGTLGVPRLTSGTVESVVLDDWQSPRRFRLLVTVDLHFDGDTAAWNEGANERFVAACRTASGDYLLELSTGP